MTLSDGNRPTRADVIAAYRVMLGREPESEAALLSHLEGSATVRELLRNMVSSTEFSERVQAPPASSPFFHFNTCVNVSDIIESHARRDRAPRAGHLVNYLGVAVPVGVMDSLHDRGGQLEGIPIPANFHAEMAEWGAALRSVDLAHDKFSMIELGCGWGCWMNNTGVAARSRGLAIDLTGIEGDPKHIDMAHETLAANGIRRSEYEVLPGVAAGGSGYALFPRRQENEEHWGFEPVFGATREESEKAVASGRFESLRMVPLADAIGDRKKIDLLHMDIQGGEAELVKQTLQLLSDRVAYVVIGTHSRALEGRLMDTLLDAEWTLEIERPAIFNIVAGKPQTAVDGVQGWSNPKFHPR